MKYGQILTDRGLVVVFLWDSIDDSGNDVS
jgi:hypothetical protein